MNLEYLTKIPPTGEFWNLFLTTGWNDEYRFTPGRLAEAIKESWCAVSVYEGDRLVGFGRVVSDGVLHAMIYDLIVDPEFQHRGIGSEILRLLIDRCRDARIPDIQLFCARGKKAFYERHGFAVRPDDAPGMQCISL